jgi:hypothetical protein
MSSLEWRKSSYSSGEVNSDCVELARLSGSIAIRDSKHPEHGHLTLSAEAFGTLVNRVKGHRFG